jgi:hypothetical protein
LRERRDRILDKLIAAGVFSAADTEAARAELRLAHLRAHLHARDVLTETQRRTYHRLRWGEPKTP